MSADWHDTIQRYMSGSTTREESEALEDALKNDAELRLLYLDYLNLDLALEAKAETSGELAEIVPISDLNSAPASSRKPMRSVLAIAAVFALLLSLATLFFKPTSEPAAWVWQATGTQTVSVGESLSPGRVVNLLSGQVRIRFAWGAILAVESPAEFTILGQNSARLIRGQATVRVPGKKKGFTVVTPTERVIDLGTSFGVDVARSGATEISVFEGEVKLGAEQRLTAGQSVEVAEARSEPKEIPHRKDRMRTPGKSRSAWRHCQARCGWPPHPSDVHRAKSKTVNPCCCFLKESGSLSLVATGSTPWNRACINALFANG